MKLKSISLLVALIAGAQVQAKEVTLFDAAEQCQVRSTSQGDRYVAPCSLPDALDLSRDGQLPDVMKSLSNNSQLSYNFSCESLRPFSLDYQVISAGQVVKQGSLSPKQSSIEFGDLTGDSQFAITGFNGLVGFQALKPGCQLTVNTNDAIESRSISILQRALVAKAKIAKPLLEYNGLNYQSRLDEANEWLKTVMGFVVLTTQPQMGQQLLDLLNLVNQHKLACLQGNCSTQAAEEFNELYQQYKQQLIEIRNYLQQRVDTFTEEESDRATEYRNLLIYLNIELYKL